LILLRHRHGSDLADYNSRSHISELCSKPKVDALGGAHSQRGDYGAARPRNIEYLTRNGGGVILPLWPKHYDARFAHRYGQVLQAVVADQALAVPQQRIHVGCVFTHEASKQRNASEFCQIHRNVRRAARPFARTIGTHHRHGGFRRNTLNVTEGISVQHYVAHNEHAGTVPTRSHELDQRLVIRMVKQIH
jgi:hypothetical protein